MNGVQKKVRVLFGKLWVIHCERKTNFVILSIVRGSIVRRNLHHKISHNIENYLQWEKKIFFSSFSWELISLCELSVWRMTYLTSVYAKSCPFHGFVFSFDFFFLSWGNSWEWTSGPSVSSEVCHRDFCVSSSQQRQYPLLDEDSVVSSTFPCFLFFCPFKG